MEVVPIPPAQLPRAWWHVEPLAKKVAERWPDDWPLTEIFRQAFAGTIAIWLVGDKAPKAIIATQLLVKPTGKRTMVIKWCAGEDRASWLPAVRDRMVEHAIENDCSELTILDARLGWERDLPNVRRERSVTLTMDLPHGEE